MDISFEPEPEALLPVWPEYGSMLHNPRWAWRQTNSEFCDSFTVFSLPQLFWREFPGLWAYCARNLDIKCVLTDQVWAV